MVMSRDLLLTSLTAFYTSHPEYAEPVVSITSGESQLSLRILDWFVTHYARIKHIVYYIDSVKNKFLDSYPSSGGGAHIRKFNLYLEYRKQLQSYTKMFFDPFRRHERISFIMSKEPLNVIESTVGQLNFFRWATENHVIEYVQQHLSEIETHMATSQKAPHPKRSIVPKRDFPNTLMHGPCHVLFN